MNNGVGMTLVLSMFPGSELRNMYQRGEVDNIFLSTNSGTYHDGKPFMIRTPKDIPDLIHGISLRQVILKRGAVLTEEQKQFLKNRHRYNLQGEFFKVEK
jgi:hypothetical protein